jgi:hypothetical protein
MNLVDISRKVALAFTVSIMAACAQPKIIVNDDISRGSVPNTALAITDERPSTDKDYSIGSLLVSSDKYGIWTLGDEMFQPPVPILLRNSLDKEISNWKQKPVSIDIKLKRLKFEANHQADLLASSSTQLGPLGVVIAESMHGKKFEMRYDKTRPFVLGFIDADVKIRYGNRETETKSLSVYKAENFSSHMDVQGRMDAARKVLIDLFGTFSSSMKSM